MLRLLHQALFLFLHLDRQLDSAARSMGHWLYLLLFAIVFCETGLVVTPFLPGDSLLFALGALAAKPGSAIDLPIIILLLCAAANCGDATNYFLGYTIGPRIFRKDRSFLLNRRHLEEAQRFYDRHGRGTIILARFVPIIRTFAPFVAGIGKMKFARFAAFSVAGGVLWVVSVSLAGYFFGQIPVVKNHFEIVVLAIVAISLIPAAWHALAARHHGGRYAPSPTDQLVAASPTAQESKPAM